MPCKYLKNMLVAVVTGLAGTACNTPGKTTTITPDYDKVTGLLTRLSHDSDGDGRVDMWAVMNGAVVVRIEADEDANGSVDRWEYYATGNDPAGAENAIEKINRSTRRDGHVNRWEYFEGGRLSRVEEDTNGDGKLDKWEQYLEGSLSLLAIDTVGRGAPDRRLLYNADGSFHRIERDADGTGHFEVVKQ